MTRKIASPPAARYVQHPKRPEWGVGRILDVQDGAVRVSFADGVVRSFRGDVLAPAEAPPEGEVAAPVSVVAAPAPKRARKPAKART